MQDKYQLNLSRAERALFHRWNKDFPPQDWERLWAEQVEQVEGYANPFIKLWATYSVT